MVNGPHVIFHCGRYSLNDIVPNFDCYGDGVAVDWITKLRHGVISDCTVSRISG